MIQDLIDRHYHSAYEKAWADQAAGRITTDEAIDRCHAGAKWGNRINYPTAVIV